MGTTDRLIEGLIGDLQPVRPVARLRIALGVVLGAWALELIVLLALHEGPPGFSTVGVDRVYAPTAAALLLGAIGATLSALAGSRPGRETLERIALGLGLGGLGLAVIAGLSGWLVLGLDAPVPPGADRACLSLGMALSIPPGAALYGLVLQGWPGRPWRAAAIALLASGGLGAIAVHLVCDIPAPLHLLRAHVAVPPLLVALGLGPAGGWMTGRRGR